MTRPLPSILGPFLDKAEARRARAYQDGKGVWTIGVGHTGPEVHAGLVWPDALIDQARDADALKAAGLIERRVGAAVVQALTDHQYAALISFVFNLGAMPGWTIWKRLKAGDLASVPREMARFHWIVHPDGTKEDSPGLRNRRAAEVLFWETPDGAKPAEAMAVAGIVGAPPSGYVREAATPPAVADPKPLSHSRSFVTAVTTAAASLATTLASALPSVKEGVKGLADQIAPLSGGSELVAKAHSTMVAVVAGLTIATVVLIWIGKRQA
jgi:lysozyme